MYLKMSFLYLIISLEFILKCNMVSPEKLRDRTFEIGRNPINNLSCKRKQWTTRTSWF
jgi:hypothetical protein